MTMKGYLILTTLACAAFVLAGVGQSYAAVNLDEAFAIWLFDEEDDTVVDQSDQGNDATLTGGEWVEGRFGGALQVDGVATVMSPTANGVSSQIITQVLWARFDDFATESQFGFINVPGQANARFFYFSNWVGAGAAPYNGIHLGVIDTAGNWGRGLTSAPNQFDTDEWYHIAGVADTVEGTLKAYVDGELVHEQAMATGDIPGTPTEIWAGSGPEGKPMLGAMDEVAFFNIALTQEDIQDIMAEGLSNAAAVEPGDKLSITWADLKR